MSSALASKTVDKVLAGTIMVLSIVMVIFHMVSTQYLFLGYDLQKNTHLGFALVIIFLTLALKKPKTRALMLLFVLLSVIATAYIFTYYSNLLERVGFPLSSDIVIGLILIILIMEATRRKFGLVLPIFVLVFIAYALFGSYIPGVFHIPNYTPVQVLTKIALDFGRGIYGDILSISVNYIFLFIIFGTLIEACRGLKFFEQVGRLAGRRMSGGAALSAVASSGLMGMVTGTASSNIVVTGSFTIPTMKKVGYPAYQAGAIEAAASTIGQIMPPVMGATAFVMAYFTETPYVKIMVYAFLPAILTYLCLALYVQLQAMKQGIRSSPELVDYKVMLKFAPMFLIPLAVLIVLLLLGFTPMFTIFWAIISIAFLSFLRKDTRISLKGWMAAFKSGASLGCDIAAMCAIIGIVVALVITTGLGIKLPSAVELVSGGNLIIALILLFFVTIILGMGMPTTAAYTLVVLMIAPFIIKLGVPVLIAHFFVFYYACFSLLTPPVAPGALTAAAMAGANYFRTAFEAVKIASGGFIIPFLMLWCPVLMLQPENALSGALDLIVAILIMMLFQIVLVGHYFVACNLWERLLGALIVISLIAYTYSNNYVFLIGIALFAFLTFVQLVKRQRKSRAGVSALPV